MKIFIFLLILAAFIQTSFVPINLVLILLIARSLVISEKENLIAAFFAGILVGILQAENIGFWALVFVVVVKLLPLSKSLPFSKNIFTILVVSALAILLVSGLESFYFQTSIELGKIIWEIVFILPVYFILLFWEERFVVKHDTRLKLRS